MRRFGLFVLACFVVVISTASPARAQEADEEIYGYDIHAAIQDDGTVDVVETIAYDFGRTPHHGILRVIPTRYEYDSTHERVTPLSDISVTSDTAPAQFTLEGDTIKIGDPNQVIMGGHTYEIRYTLDGALNPFDDHDELYWNAIGPDWNVPISDVTASISAPVAIDRALCFTGPVGSTLPCETTSMDGATVRFSESTIDPHEPVTLVAALPPGSVTATGPILEEIWSAADAFSTDGPNLAASGALLGLVVGATGFVTWKVGRDRRAIGSAVDAAFGDDAAGDERVPLRGGYDGPVQVEPPDGLRPGQIGTLIDERANPLDVTATIVDLAVRGFLRIEEIPKEGWFGKPDWRLVKLRDADGLLRYEEILLNSLFKGGDVIELSELKDTFAKQLRKVQQALYEDAIDQGWFRHSPEKTRAQWVAIGIGVLVLGVAMTAAAAALTTFGLLPIPIVVGGILLIALSGRMPHRTPKGTGALVRTLGFKQFIDDSEKDRARFAEQQHLFTEYLPYAVVFGATERWAKAFAGLDGELPDQSSWYVSSHPFTFMAFSSSMDGFATTAAGTIASTPSSSGTSGFGGGGFSGGGVGGGGGGSW
jgi:uncharacterized membrane protein YgcG